MNTRNIDPGTQIDIGTQNTHGFMLNTTIRRSKMREQRVYLNYS